MKLFKHIIITCAALWVSTTAWAQMDTITMVTGDTIWVDLCGTSSGVIVDNGGINQNYSDAFDGWVAIRVYAGAAIRLEGRYRTEECCDWLKVSDNRHALTSELRGIGTVDVTCQDLMIVEFHSDGSAVDSGFVLRWSAVDPNTGTPLPEVCLWPVTGLQATATTAGSISLSWSCSYTGSTNTEIRYRQESQYNWQSVYIGSALRSYTLTGLNAGTQYCIYVGQGGPAVMGTTCCMDSLRVRTECGSTVLTYSEGMEGLSEGTLPPCWLRVANFDDEEMLPHVVTEQHYRGQRSLMISCGSTAAATHFALVATQPLGLQSASTGAPYITMQLAASHSGTQAVVGLCDASGSDYNQYGFVPLDTVEIGDEGQWHTYTLQVPATAWGNVQRRVAVKMLQGMQNGTARMLYIDNLGVNECRVDSLTVRHLGDSLYEIGWQQYGCTQVRVDVTRAGGGGQHYTAGTASSPLQLTLMPASDYTITVTPICGYEGLAAQTTLRTAARPYSGARWCFDNQNYDDMTFTNCSEIWPDGVSGLHMRRNADGYAFAATPAIDALGGKEIMLVITGYYCEVITGLMGAADDTASFVPFDTSFTDYYQNKYIHFTIPTNATGQRVGIKFRDHDVAIRRLEVGNCLVDSLRAPHRRGSSITLAWANMGVNDTIIVEYGQEGFELGSGDTAVFVGQRRGTISGLNPSQWYDFIVNRPCSGEACGTSRLRTYTADRDYPIPYCEDFEVMDWWNEFAWRGWDGFNNTPRWDFEYINSQNKRVLELGSYGFDWTFFSSVILPDAPVDTGTLMSFYATNVAPGGRLLLGSYTNDTYQEGLYFFDTIELAADGQRHHYVTRLPQNDTMFDGRIALRYYHSAEFHNYRCYIDELHLSPAAYNNFEVPFVGFDSATVKIDSVTGADSVRIWIIGGGDTLSVTLLTVLQPIEAHFGGLDSGTLYQCYVLPLNDTLGCPSHAGSFMTNYIGEGSATCFTFDGLLSYEVPNGWLATAVGVNVGTDDRLHLQPGAAVATQPLNQPAGMAVRFDAAGDTLVLAVAAESATSLTISAMTHFDTIILGNSLQHYEMRLPSTLIAGNRLCLIARGNEVQIDNVNLLGCPIVNFVIDGTTLICTTVDGSTGYFLTVVDSAGRDAREEYVETNPYRMQALLPNSCYYIEYRCPSENDSACFPTAVVHTGHTVPLPYCEVFENANNTLSLPISWNFMRSIEGSSIGLDTWGPSLSMWSADGRWNYAVLPLLDSSNTLTLNLKVYSWEDNSLELGVLNSGSDTSTFVTLKSFMHDGQECTIDLSDHIGKRIAIRTRSDARIFRIHADSIPIISYGVINSRTMSAKRSRPTDYWLHLRDVNGYGIDTTIHVDTSLITFTVPEEWINEIYASSSSDSTFSNCFTETSIVLSDLRDLPYCENNWWDWYYRRHSSLSWHYPGEEWYSDEDGSTYYFNVNNLWDLSEILVLPEPNIDSVKHASMTFKMQSPYSEDFIIVGVMTDALDTASFVPIDTLYYTTENSDWQNYSVSFASYTGSGRWIAFRHTNGYCTEFGDCCAHLHIDNVQLFSCPSAAGATATLERWNTVLIDNPSLAGQPLTGSIYVEYGYEGFWQGSGTIVRIDSLPTRLTLQPSTHYDFYFSCDSTGASCSPVQHVTTHAAPQPVPACINFDTCQANSIPANWTIYNSEIGVTNTEWHTSNNCMQLPVGLRSYIVSPDIDVDTLRKTAVSLWFKADDENCRLVVGTMSDPANFTSFYPLRTIAPSNAGNWERALIDISNAPTSAHYLAFRARSNRTSSTSNIYLDDIYIDTCAAFGLSVSTLTDGSITFKWSQVGEPNISIEMLENGVSTATYSTATGNIDATGATVTISPLQPLVGYTFHFSSYCGGSTGGYCNIANRDTVSIVTPAPGLGCINPTDLQSPQAVFYSGTYSHPYANEGAVNNGPLSAESRHTVCYDTSMRDPRTEGLLRTIPEGYTSSLRLGNWGSNSYAPEAEGVIYSLTVDTADFELLLLRYAAVLQDPMHAPEDQPRFRLEVLDSAFALIDSACTSADFIADQTLGWNSAADNVLWKDWTAVGIDLSAYAGQQVYVRLTTFDCNEGSHYGYAYFTLECMRKHMETTACGAIDSNTFTAPAGFNYRWYTSQSSATVSTQQSITAPSADITYYCELSKLDNTACHFTISAYGGTRYPMAAFDTSIVVSDCRFYVNFTNTSSVSADGVTPIDGEGCESAYWNFGNGLTSTTYHASTVYTLPGTYTVMLISGIAGDACTDTAFMNITLEIPGGMLPMDTTHGTICSNQRYVFYGDSIDVAGVHTHAVSTGGNCDSLHILYLTVNPTSASDTIATACDQFAWRDTVFASTRWLPTFYQRTLNSGTPNAYGCDSTVTLHLTLYSRHDATLADSVVENDMPYSVAGTLVTLNDITTVNSQYATFDSTYALTSAEGCDSTLALSLKVWLNSDSYHLFSTCRDQLPFTFNCDSLTADSSYIDRVYYTQTTHGADSTIHLHLDIINNPDTTILDTVVENQLPYTFRGRTFTGPTDTVMMLAATTGCDTTTAYSLTVWYNQSVRLEQTVCDDTLPLVWDGHTFAGSDSVTFTVPDIHGADSVITLVLYVNPTYDVADTHIICPSQGYIYEDVDYGGPAQFDAPHVSMAGCDSLVHVVLAPRDSTYRLHPLYLTSHNMTDWLPLDTIVLGCAPDTVHLRDTTRGAIGWQWTIFTPADTTVYTDSAASHIFPDTIYTAMIQLIISSDVGCVDTVEQPVNIFRSPTAEFDWNPTVPAIDNPEVTFHNTSTPADSLTWLWYIPLQPGSIDFDTSTLFEPTYHWGQPGDNTEGDYDVRLVAYWTQQHGTVTHTCTDTATHTIYITNDFLQFPNLVTPNGDGKNDIWRVVNLLEYGNYPVNELWIYNQWGVEIYHVRDISQDSHFWDPNATSSPDGTYYYRFTARGPYGLVKRNGIIEVLRK